MYVDLCCSKCDACSRVSFASLYELWKEGYEKMCDKHKKRARAVTNIKCHCGHNEKYDGLMFSYIFQLIFDEFIQEKEA
jgi:hypothetical protein